MALKGKEFTWPGTREEMEAWAACCGRDDVSPGGGRGTTHHATCDCSMWELRQYVEALEAEVREAHGTIEKMRAVGEWARRATIAEDGYANKALHDGMALVAIRKLLPVEDGDILKDMAEIDEIVRGGPKEATDGKD